tara:strand:+ start:79 stop:1467 length:1389 start_codon:yes stop_codon:yes gene_type:complete
MINSQLLKNKLCYLIILTGLIFSIYNSFQIVLKNDYFFERDDGSVRHRIIHSSPKGYWDHAHLFKKDLEENKSFLESGADLEMDYLYPKLIAFYYKIIDEDIKDDKNNFKLKNYKFGIPIIQSVIYFFILYLFYRKIKNKFDIIVVVSVISFLGLEPTILTYHSSFWSESLYFSLLLLLFIFFLDPPKEYYKFFFLGLFLGLLYMQRSVTLLLFLPLSFYLIVMKKKSGVIQSFLMIIGYILVLTFIGYNENKKSGVFYFTPHTQGDAHWHYVSHILNAKKLNISYAESSKKKYEDLELWIEENDIDRKIVRDKRKILNYKKNYFFDSLQGNFVEYLKFHIYKSFQFFLINFSHSNIHLNIDKSQIDWWKTDDFKKHLKLIIFYSSIIYLICLLGLINLILDSRENRKLIFFVTLIVLYYTAILGWTGIPRYNICNLMFLSIFFGFGIDLMFNKIKKLLSVK